MRASVDRLVINRRAGPADFLGRFIFVRADPVMLEKSRGFHTGDGPTGTVLTIATAAELRETFFLGGSNPQCRWGEIPSRRRFQVSGGCQHCAYACGGEP